MSKAVIAMMAAGTAMQALGAYQQGQNAKRLNNYNAAIQERNAELARQDNELRKKELKRKYRQLTGSQKVAFAKAGVELSFDVDEESAVLFEEDMMMLQYNLDKTVSGFQIESDKSRFMGKIAAQEGKARAASTLLTGGSKTYKTGTDLGVFS
tara:strand:+ start:9861 stop:10319 length:459 start_codon:yes stop_codon:yes gene_type:complete